MTLVFNRRPIRVDDWFQATSILSQPAIILNLEPEADDIIELREMKYRVS